MGREKLEERMEKNGTFFLKSGKEGNGQNGHPTKPKPELNGSCHSDSYKFVCHTRIRYCLDLYIKG